jgi:hypothetical protein
MLLTNPNIYTNGLGLSLTYLLKNHAIIYYAIGGGDSHWDIEIDKGQSKKDKTRIKLFDELYRVKVDNSLDMDYLDENNDVSSNPTNRLQLRATIPSAEAQGSHREFGVFIDVEGNDIPNKDDGTLIIHEIHDIKEKGDIEIERTVNMILAN